jgi:hypothetical protein
MIKKLPVKTKDQPMKIFTNILVLIAISLLIFNVTLIDFHNPFKGDSVIALVGVVASFCAVLILLIFRMSKKIVEKMNDNR